MPRNLSTLQALFSLGLVALPSSALAAPSRQECTDAYSQGQDLRDKGKIVEAREAFLLCAQSSCPQLVQNDCAQFGNDMARLIPSLSFAARVGNKDLPDTVVSVDGKEVTNRLDDGKAHEVNPGRHTLRFVHAGKEVTLEVVVAQGEKARTIVATFPDTQAAATSSAPVSTAASPPPPPPPSRSITPLIVTGLGGAALIGGAALLFYGRSQIPSACKLSSHECQAPPGDPAFEDARKSVSTMNVGFVVGGVGAAVTVSGLLWYFMSGPSESRQSVAPWAAPRSAGLSYGLRFLAIASAAGGTRLAEGAGVMLAVAFDSSEGCAVLVVNPPQGDAGWRAYAQAIDDLQARVDRSTRPVLVQVLRRGLDVPNPVVRRELAQLRARIRADAINTVVAEDASVRLMQTALDWLRRPHYDSSTFSDFTSAHAHIEKALGRPLPRLPELHRKALAGR